MPTAADGSVILGSYERFVFGYDLHLTNSDSGKGANEARGESSLTPAFACPAHLSSVRCVCVKGDIAASGGSDDTIRIFDLSSRRDLGVLTGHDGSVTCIDIHSRDDLPYLLASGGEDGAIHTWHVESFEKIRELKGHQGTVNGLALHSTGSLALSVGRDQTLKMWDLSKKGCTFTKRLPNAGEWISFDDSGSEFVVQSAQSVTLHTVDRGVLPRAELLHDRRVLCCTLEGSSRVYTGGEDKAISLWDFRSGKRAGSIGAAHSRRIKGLCVPTEGLLLSADSDGIVRLWDSRMFASRAITGPIHGDPSDASPLLFEEDTDARITCMATSLFGHKKSSMQTNAKPKGSTPSGSRAGTVTHRERTAAEVDEADAEIQALLKSRQRQGIGKGSRAKKSPSAAAVGGGRVRKRRRNGD